MLNSASEVDIAELASNYEAVILTSELTNFSRSKLVEDFELSLINKMSEEYYHVSFTVSSPTLLGNDSSNESASIKLYKSGKYLLLE